MSLHAYRCMCSQVHVKWGYCMQCTSFWHPERDLHSLLLYWCQSGAIYVVLWRADSKANRHFGQARLDISHCRHVRTCKTTCNAQMPVRNQPQYQATVQGSFHLKLLDWVNSLACIALLTMQMRVRSTKLKVANRNCPMMLPPVADKLTLISIMCQQCKNAMGKVPKCIAKMKHLWATQILATYLMLLLRCQRLWIATTTYTNEISIVRLTWLPQWQRLSPACWHVAMTHLNCYSTQIA